MRKRRRQPSLEAEQAALRMADENPGSPGAIEALRATLRSGRSLMAARAAQIIKEHRLDELTGELVLAFDRFLADPVKNDPSCHAKLAILEALDEIEAMSAAPFLSGARHIQKEPAWGPPVDTAAGVRARSVVALARIGYADLDLLAAELLADPEAPVRRAAADALAVRGLRTGAALALVKLRLGDDDPLVTLAAMSALLTLAPDVALTILDALLEDEETRELAAVPPGQSRREDALELLRAALARCVRSRERLPLLRAIGLHRSDAALAIALDVIADGAPPDAEAAVAALGARRFEPGIAARVRAAATRNGQVDLSRAIARAFPDEKE